MNELDAFFNNLEEKDKNFKAYVSKYSALASFVTDLDLLKGHNRLTQKDIASKAGTTQSAISRIESLKANPSYNVLRKLSDAVGGRLLITPMADMTITLPFDMQEKVAALAAAENKSPAEFMLDIIKNEVVARWEEAGIDAFEVHASRVDSLHLDATGGEYQVETVVNRIEGEQGDDFAA